MGAPEADDGDGADPPAFAGGYTAGEVVVEVEESGRLLLGVGEAEDLLRVFEEDMAGGVAAVEVEEAEVELLGGAGLRRRGRRGRRRRRARIGGRGESGSEARKTATRVTRRVCVRRSTRESTRARRSVCELRERPKSMSVSR